MLNIFKNIFKTDIRNTFNYIEDQNGIIRRYKKEKENWDKHLEATKDYISQFVLNHTSTNVAILGSGWLLDVPLDEIAKHSKKVLLVDIYHPKKIKQYVKSNYNNVEFLEADINGGVLLNIQNAIKTYQQTKQKVTIETICKSNFTIDNTYNTIISVNLLNQLDIIVADYLKKQKIYNSNEIREMRRLIQTNHLNFLKTKNSCLISDIEELLKDNTGKIIAKNNLLYADIKETYNVKQWEWIFDTHKLYNPNYNTIFNVIAFTINP